MWKLDWQWTANPVRWPILFLIPVKIRLIYTTTENINYVFVLIYKGKNFVYPSEWNKDAWCTCHTVFIPLHIASVPVQAPFPMHCLIAEPLSTNPGLHWNFTISPMLYLLPSLRPLMGVPRTGQSVSAIKTILWFIVVSQYWKWISLGKASFRHNVFARNVVFLLQQ